MRVGTERQREAVCFTLGSALSPQPEGGGWSQMWAAPGPSLQSQQTQWASFTKAHLLPPSASAPEGSPARNQLCSQHQGPVSFQDTPGSPPPWQRRTSRVTPLLQTFIFLFAVGPLSQYPKLKLQSPLNLQTHNNPILCPQDLLSSALTMETLESLNGADFSPDIH